jgi:hypothetical protein
MFRVCRHLTLPRDRLIKCNVLHVRIAIMDNFFGVYTLPACTTTVVTTSVQYMRAMSYTACNFCRVSQLGRATVSAYAYR